MKHDNRRSCAQRATPNHTGRRPSKLASWLVGVTVVMYLSGCAQAGDDAQPDGSFATAAEDLATPDGDASGSDAPGAAAPEAQAGNQPWTPPADDPTQPSPSAYQTLTEVTELPNGIGGCGIANYVAEPSPTTTPSAPGARHCIELAFERGLPARYAIVERAGTNGLAVKVYQVDESGQASFQLLSIGADGALTTAEERNCAQLVSRGHFAVDCLDIATRDTTSTSNGN